MSIQKTKIQWADATWNPWYGCIKVSPGCKGCYMYREMEFYNQHDPSVVARSKTKFNEPLAMAKDDEIKFVFTCSWSDWFIEHADQWRDEAWDIVLDTPGLVYLILTKRPQLIPFRLPSQAGHTFVPENVWIGTSIENMDTLHTRYHEMSKLKFFYPDGLYWLSIEPLLEPIADMLDFFIKNDEVWKPSWVVIGGESGDPGSKKYAPRECRFSWLSDIVEVCQKYKIPVFVKQVGTYLAMKHKYKDRHGGNIDEFPEALQVRERPST